MTLPEILTPHQIRQATALYKTYHGTGQFATKCCMEIITPNIAAINKKLGQENDPMFLAYAVEYVLMSSL